MREELVREVQRCLGNERTLADIETWSAPYFASFAELPDSDPVRELWGTLQACLYELEAGHVDEAWCRAELAATLPAVTRTNRGS